MPVSWDDWLAAEPPAPSGPSRTAVEVAAAAPYTGLPEGQQVWTEEQLMSSLGTDTSILGTGFRGMDFESLPFRALSNWWGDQIGLVPEEEKKSFSDHLGKAMAVWSGLGHKDPETGEITGQAQFEGGRTDLGRKLELAVMGHEDEIGGLINDNLPDFLKGAPSQFTSTIVRAGLNLAGGILESPSAMAAMGGSMGAKYAAAEASLAPGAGAAMSKFGKGLYLTEEIAQKAVAGTAVARGLDQDWDNAKKAWEANDMEGASKHAAEGVSKLILGALLARGVKGDFEDVSAKAAKEAAEKAAKEAAAVAKGTEAAEPAVAKPTADEGTVEAPVAVGTHTWRFKGEDIAVNIVGRNKDGRVTIARADGQPWETGKRTRRANTSRMSAVEEPEKIAAPPEPQVDTPESVIAEIDKMLGEGGAKAVDTMAARTMKAAGESAVTTKLIQRGFKHVLDKAADPVEGDIYLRGTQMPEVRVFTPDDADYDAIIKEAGEGSETAAAFSIRTTDASGAERPSKVFLRGDLLTNTRAMMHAAAHELAHEKLDPVWRFTSYDLKTGRPTGLINAQGGHARSFRPEQQSQVMDLLHMDKTDRILNGMQEDPVVRQAIERASGPEGPAVSAEYPAGSLALAREVGMPAKDEFGRPYEQSRFFNEEGKPYDEPIDRAAADEAALRPMPDMKAVDFMAARGEPREWGKDIAPYKDAVYKRVEQHRNAGLTLTDAIKQTQEDFIGKVIHRDYGEELVQAMKRDLASGELDVGGKIPATAPEIKAAVKDALAQGTSLKQKMNAATAVARAPEEVKTELIADKAFRESLMALRKRLDSQIRSARKAEGGAGRAEDAEKALGEVPKLPTGRKLRAQDEQATMAGGDLGNNMRAIWANPRGIRGSAWYTGVKQALGEDFGDFADRIKRAVNEDDLDVAEAAISHWDRAFASEFAIELRKIKNEFGTNDPEAVVREAARRAGQEISDETVAKRVQNILNTTRDVRNRLDQVEKLKKKLAAKRKEAAQIAGTEEAPAEKIAAPPKPETPRPTAGKARRTAPKKKTPAKKKTKAEKVTPPPEPEKLEGVEKTEEEGVVRDVDEDEGDISVEFMRARTRAAARQAGEKGMALPSGPGGRERLAGPRIKNVKTLRAFLNQVTNNKAVMPDAIVKAVDELRRDLASGDIGGFAAIRKARALRQEIMSARPATGGTAEEALRELPMVKIAKKAKAKKGGTPTVPKTPGAATIAEVKGGKVEVK